LRYIALEDQQVDATMTTPNTTSPTPAKPVRARPQVMTLTDTAAARVAAITASKPGVIGLKIGVKKGGCAGMEYTMTWAETQDKFDEVVESQGAKVLIDPMAVLYLLGTEMDYTTTKLSSTFVFNNPNQKSACGCGESVNLMPAAKEKLEAV
jgi:iron-sulfur cluster assembly protein